MSVPAPHYLLYAEAAQAADCAASNAGRWRFVLRQPGGATTLDAADEEPEAGPDRLELLAVVRGLEALESPSRVTLMTGSRNIRRGLDSGLSQWRESDWQWERYGRMTPVKNGDLWRRLDRLLEIHAIDCRPARVAAVDDLAAPAQGQGAGFRVQGSAVGSRRRGTPKQSSGASRRTFRVDEPHGEKHEIRNPKSETNSKLRKKNVANSGGFGPLNLLLSNLFRASRFVLRIFLSRGASSYFRSTQSVGRITRPPQTRRARHRTQS